MANWIDKGNGKYKLIAELGYDAKGKRIRKSKTLTLDRKPKKGELELAAAKFEESVKNGDWVKPNAIGFEDFVLGDWKKNYVDLKMGEYTRKVTMAIMRGRLIPHFGRYQMDRITTMQIVRYFSDLRAPGARKDRRKGDLATNTLLNIYKALKAVFESATKWGIIANNPMDGVDRPTASKSEQRALKNRKKSYTPEESESVILALYAEPDVWRLYFIGVLLGGYRRGEFLAIEWSEVDFEKSRIYVDTQITFDEEGNVVDGDVKTVESEGWVSMPRWYMNQLEAYKRLQIRLRMKMDPLDWKGGNKQYVFHSGYGAAYYPNTPSLRWRKIREKYNLPRVRLHDLRHTTAELLRDFGADLKSIQGQLRHSRLATTTDTYMKRDTDHGKNGNLLEILDPKKKDDGHQMDTSG